MNPIKHPHRFLSPVAAGLFIVNLLLIRTLDSFGTPLTFASALLVELLLLIVIVYSGLIAFKKPLRIAKSIAASAIDGLLTNRYIKDFEIKEAPLIRFVRRRLDPDSPTGLVLTIGSLVSLIWLVNFINVVRQIDTNSLLAAADIRVINLLPHIRTQIGIDWFRFVTFLGNWQTIYPLTVGLAAYFYSQKQRWTAGWLIAGLAAYELTINLVKQLVQRGRPPLPIITTDSLSFPSGHVLATTILFGLIAYIWIRSVKKHLSRLVIVLGSVTVVFMVALSRIYLGVHWPSDTLASLYLGLLILSLLITAGECLLRNGTIGSREFRLKSIGWVPLMLMVWSFVIGPSAITILHPSAQTSVIQIPFVNAITVHQLPLYSETLTGAHMEPISFIYVGSRQEIVDLFTTHGWYLADPANLPNTLKAIAIGIQNRQYLNAPVSPAYLNANPEDIAFEQPTIINSVRQRHHTRLWQTDFVTAAGQPIWVATASFDVGVKIVSNFWIPNHTIDPNVDAERSYIIKSLDQGRVPYLQVVAAQSGQNAAGDHFFTDGKAALIELPSVR